MTDERRFDDLLREDAAALPPPAAGMRSIPGAWP